MSEPAVIEEEFVGPEWVAKRYGVDITTVRKRAGAGLIPAIKIGSLWRFRKSDVIAAIEVPFSRIR